MMLKTLHLSDSYGRLSWHEAGQGAPVVLIHGVGMQSAAWEPQIAALSDSHHVIALDMPGHGGSGLLPESAALPDFVDWLHAALLALDLGPVSLAGHSMGALIAAGYAVTHPEMVTRVALLNGVFCRDAPARAAVEARAAEIRAGMVDLETPLARWFGSGDDVRSAREKVAGWLRTVDLQGYATAYSAFACGDRIYADRFGDIACPLLAMTGELDPNSTPGMSHAMTAAAQHGHAVIMKGHRHMINLTSAEEVNRELRHWLNTSATGGDDMNAIDPRALRNAFGTFMTGVTVVTTKDPEGKPVGFTANSFTSVSLDPPLVLVCLANSSRNRAVFAEASGFAVNVLSEGQKHISNTFARPVEDRFEDVTWRDAPFGAPILDDVSAWFDCSRHKLVEAGDHVILIGKVEAFDESPAPGLGYARGAYVTPAMEAQALGQQADLMVAALIEYQGEVLLVENDNGELTLPLARVGKQGVSATLVRLISEFGVETEPGFIYAVYEDADAGCQHISFLCQSAEPVSGRGTFQALTPSVLAKIADPAMRTMLKRFAAESRIGNFGVYYGNQVSGKVRPIAAGSGSQ
ncbi:alpha/beta fold hydrolase [Paracoccus saliphilus]|uniref:Alpha/beta fold hydrolase n=1 Tax=Paracoccus saliphilus TaxID=405559 RepID=A0AA46A6L5_9RHOB|nr:alpha/beta fold hydrolase [Paracoccus saliphilus]WCR01500.1 alpha/beta fold hydrolase [Paracoccus saliphilus]SIS99590.1 NADH-FMN oxidoreductase RutF, flavin reductase (DIM6/NTAB) family [Paracoccus saliphilus]